MVFHLVFTRLGWPTWSKKDRRIKTLPAEQTKLIDVKEEIG